MLKGPQGQKKRFNLQHISDAIAFFHVIERQTWFVNEDLQCQKRDTRFALIGLLLLTVFALNGWFEFCCLDSLWIEVPSVLAKILFPVILISIVLQFIWLLPSQRKQKKREAETEGQALVGELPEAHSPRWYTRWSWLLWLLGAVGWIVLITVIIQALRA